MFLVSYGFADAERWALQTTARTALLFIGLAALVLVLKITDRAMRRERLPMNFDARPAPATQRLGLFERVVNHD